MKLAPTLVQFLHANKRLILPGIGTLHLDPSVYIDPDNSRNSKALQGEGVTFQNDPLAKIDDELILYISTQTGKMRALALADFESYLELMQQFLNIGKPFQIDGVGILAKIKHGLYEFTPEHLLNEKIKDPNKDLTATATEENLNSYKQLYRKQPQAGFTLKKAFIALLLFGGIGTAVWGGYALYNKNRTAVLESEDTPAQKEVSPQDSIRYTTENIPVDTVKKAQPVKQPGYKFVFESIANKNKAMRRFKFLKNINSEIHLETTDSTLFKITVNLEIPASDTLRIKDSLNSWYYGKKDMLVKIESNVKQNVP